MKRTATFLVLASLVPVVGCSSDPAPQDGSQDGGQDGGVVSCDDSASGAPCDAGGLPDGDACMPTTCAAQGKNCGTILDGCDASLNCGTCSSSESCGGSGTPNVCGCKPITTCAGLGLNCGEIVDDCGAVVDCGTCSGNDMCEGSGIPNVCGCTPTTDCAGLGLNCGTVLDDCGTPLDCGTCSGKDTCGGGGTPNICGCTPTTTCAGLGMNCGTVQDGCGTLLDCGTCSGNDTCGGGGTPNVCGCMPESDAAFCAGLDKFCGQADGIDSCGLPRSAQCGSCAQGTCQGGLCLSECGVGCLGAEVCGNGCDDDCNNQIEEGCPPPTNTTCGAAQTITLQQGHAKVMGYIPPANPSNLYYKVYIAPGTMNYVHVVGSKPAANATMYMQVGDAQTCLDANMDVVTCNTPTFAGRYWTSGSADQWQTITVMYAPPGSFTLNVEQLREGMGEVKLQSGAQTVWTFGGKGWSGTVGGTCGGALSTEAFVRLQCPESPGGMFVADNCAHAPPLSFMDSVFYLRSGVTGLEMACNDNNPQCAAGPNRSRLTATIPPGAGMYALYYDFHDDVSLGDGQNWGAPVDVTVP